jgi:hypothetical protein
MSDDLSFNVKAGVCRLDPVPGHPDTRSMRWEWTDLGIVKAPNGPAACRSAKSFRSVPAGASRFRARLVIKRKGKL